MSDHLRLTAPARAPDLTLDPALEGRRRRPRLPSPPGPHGPQQQNSLEGPE